VGRCPHRAIRQHMGTIQLAPRGGLGGVRPYLGRMNIDLPEFSRCRFPSKYALQRRSGKPGWSTSARATCSPGSWISEGAN
jgi:hypothetical protein